MFNRKKIKYLEREIARLKAHEHHMPQKAIEIKRRDVIPSMEYTDGLGGTYQTGERSCESVAVHEAVEMMIQYLGLVYVDGVAATEVRPAKLVSVDVRKKRK